MDTNIRGYRGERFRGITVGELKALLEDEDQDAIVVFTTDYGDYHHTEQALPLKGEVESYDDARLVVKKSGYSNSGFEFREDEDADDDSEEGELIGVVVIR